MKANISYTFRTFHFRKVGILPIFVMLLSFFSLTLAEPQKTHSQVINERVLQLGRSLNSDDAVMEASILSEALNIADVVAFDYLKSNCQTGGLFEPRTDPVLCNTYPSLLLQQVRSRFSFLFSKFYRAGGAVKLPAMWLRHAQVVMTRLMEELDGQNAPYYRTMLLLIKPPEVRTVVASETIPTVKQEEKFASESIPEKRKCPLSKQNLVRQPADSPLGQQQQQQRQMEMQPAQAYNFNPLEPVHRFPNHQLRELLTGLPDELMQLDGKGKPSEIEILL